MQNNFQVPPNYKKVSTKKFKDIGAQQLPFNGEKNNQFHRFQLPNHIETQTQIQVSARPCFIVQKPSSSKMKRRRKIFQKSIDKKQAANNRENSHQYGNTPSLSPKYVKNQQKSGQKAIKMDQYSESYYTMRNIQQNNSSLLKVRQQNEIKKGKRNSPPSYCLGNQSLSSNRGSNNQQSYNHFHNYGINQSGNTKIQKSSSEQIEFEDIHRHNNSIKTQQINPKLPSFAKGSEQYSEMQKNYYTQMDSIISVIPDEVKKLKSQMLQQKRQISQLSQKLERNNVLSYRKEKQLLSSLIEKQDQLSRKQRQLNDSLEKMSKIQTESSNRYEQLLKYELELQRAKRIEMITNENERLYQQLLKNQTRDTFELAPKVNTSNLQIKQNYYVSQPMILTYSVSKNMKDDLNWRQISALSYKGQGSAFVQGSEYELHNNTIRQILSPLEIKPDYTY